VRQAFRFKLYQHKRNRHLDRTIDVASGAWNRQANRTLKSLLCRPGLADRGGVFSGLNDKRRELTRLSNKKPSRIIVEHKDRLTRFGFNYFELLLPKLGCELVVTDRDEEEKSDLMKDLVNDRQLKQAACGVRKH
jgi:hypothetical protein